MLDSFNDGIDEVMYRLAETLAKRRLSDGAFTRPVSIDVQDVKLAWSLVESAIRTQIDAGVIPGEIRASLHQIGDQTVCKFE